MPLYFFNIRGGAHFDDLDGTELADDARARQHGATVAREAMRNREIRVRHLAMEIRDQDGTFVDEFPFAKLDPTLDHLDPRLREVVEQLSLSQARLAETLRDSRKAHLQSHALWARLNRWPYLVARNGVALW